MRFGDIHNKNKKCISKNLFEKKCVYLHLMRSPFIYLAEKTCALLGRKEPYLNSFFSRYRIDVCN